MKTSVFDADRPLRMVVFFSGGASGVRYLAEHDPNYGDRYEVVGGFTDSPECAGVDYLQAADVPVVTNDIRAFYADRDAETRNMEVREEYDAETRELIARFDPDLILLSGYMWILTAPIIDTYPTINVHPADLTIEDESGTRVYTGYDPVHDAIVAGETTTRSSVHFVTTDVDEGPLLVVSEPFDVHRDLVETLAEYDADDALHSYVDAHQEWMKWDGDGPCFAKAVELIATGRVERDGSDVYIDGETGVYDLGANEIR